MGTWKCLDVAAGNWRRIGLQPATEPCHMINSTKSVNDGCSPLKSLFSRDLIFLAGSYQQHVFMSKACFLSVCFARCLKLFTVPEGSLMRKQQQHLTRNDARKGRNVTSKLCGISSSTAQNLAMAYLSLITKSRYWFSAKCWHKMSQICWWPFLSLRHAEEELRYKSWQSMWRKLFLFDIWGNSAHCLLTFQPRHQRQNVTFFFIYFGGFTN